MRSMRRPAMRSGWALALVAAGGVFAAAAA